MDAAGLAGLARRLAERRGRRAFAGGVAGALAAAVVGDATAGKHEKKATLCLNGKTIKAPRKKKKKLLKRGATAAALPASSKKYVFLRMCADHPQRKLISCSVMSEQGHNGRRTPSEGPLPGGARPWMAHASIVWLAS